MGSTARLPLSIQPVNSISIAEKAGSIGNFFLIIKQVETRGYFMWTRMSHSLYSDEYLWDIEERDYMRGLNFNNT